MYSWSRDEELYIGSFGSHGDAALDAICEADLAPGDTVTVGVNVPYDKGSLIRSYVDADYIIERLSEGAYDNVGEHAEDWPDVSDEGRKKLDDALVKAIAPFIDEPRFWSITEPKAVEITAEMFAEAHKRLGERVGREETRRASGLLPRGDDGR
jgi:hypothetical protein